MGQFLFHLWKRHVESSWIILDNYYSTGVFLSLDIFYFAENGPVKTRCFVEVVFSWNEGQSWYDFELSSMPVEVRLSPSWPKDAEDILRLLPFLTRGGKGFKNSR